MTEGNQILRSGCPSDYQISFGKYFEKVVHTDFLRFLFLPFPFLTNIYQLENLRRIEYYMVSYENEGNQKYVEDNQISNFGCPPTTYFRFEFCYPGRAVM